jgi:hypothetical protein
MALGSNYRFGLVQRCALLSLQSAMNWTRRSPQPARSWRTGTASSSPLSTAGSPPRPTYANTSSTYGTDEGDLDVVGCHL